VRETSGLALSSRNRYLREHERKDALVLHAALSLAKALVKQGVRDSRRIMQAMRKKIMSVEPARIDCLAVVDPNNLKPIRKLENTALIAVAVRIGKTRLIDNVLIHC
jgi:pantoate--beta-alanine ligase